jgi:hypothetical protein
MKKRGVLSLVFVFLSIFLTLVLISGISADGVLCSPTIQLISQDPSLASPGEYVKLVFQIEGVTDSSCGTVNFELKNEYPLIFDSGASNTYSFEAGFFQRTYGTFATVPFKVRINEDAVDGDSQIETLISYEGIKGVVNNFSISIQDLSSNFEIYVKNYDINTNIITLEILNIGKSNTKAITLILPPQDNIIVKGPNKNIAGDLDSNEYTTADFEVSGVGGKVQIQIEYTDEVNVRRSLDKTIEFDPNYFIGRKADEKKTSLWTYIFLSVVILILVLWIYRRYKRSKHRKFD